MAETESFKFNIGVLRSQMTLQIHTRQASRLWYGRRATEEKQGIVGLSAFMSISSKINIGSRHDDPYSDWWMLRVEEKIDSTKAQLEKLNEEVDVSFKSVPSAFSISENLNVQPANLPVFASSHLGYLAIYVLAQYDEIVRKALLASHIALIGHTTLEHWLDKGDQCLRSLFGMVTYYRYTGTTRKDFLEESAAALAAIEKYGEVPPDIMDGSRRSRFSPPLRIGVPDADDQSEALAVQDDDLHSEATLTLVVPTETELNAMEEQTVSDESSEEGDA